jgi:mono/diheme cytochrome c family protein
MPKAMKAALVAGFAVTTMFGFAQQPKATTTDTKIKVISIQPTSAASGSQMYVTYCAACHGASGTGTGPAATALKTAPPDLTLLSQKNGGVFPADHIYSILKFGTKAPAHGTAEMPVWGDLMMSLNQSSADGDVVVHQRISNLTNYLKQIQK